MEKSRKNLINTIILVFVTLLSVLLIHAWLFTWLPNGPSEWAATLSQSKLSASSPKLYASFYEEVLKTISFSPSPYYFHKSLQSRDILLKILLTLRLAILTILFLYPLALILGWQMYKKKPLAKHLYQMLTAASAIPSCLLYTLAILVQQSVHLSILNATAVAVLLLVTRRLAPLARLCHACYTQTSQIMFVKMAYARHIPKIKVFVLYFLPRATLPIWNKLPRQLCQILLTGCVPIEIICDIDGFGLLSYSALKTYDYPLVINVLCIITFCNTLAYLAGDYLQSQIQKT